MARYAFEHVVASAIIAALGAFALTKQAQMRGTTNPDDYVYLATTGAAAGAALSYVAIWYM